MAFEPLPPKLEKVLNNKEKLGPVRVFADLGCGIFPVAFVGDRVFKDNDYYVGVDRVERPMESPVLSTSLANFDQLTSINKNVFFLHGNVKELPFPDSSVDEVFLGNVLGEANIDNVDPFIEQANRILKPGGTFIIFEFITPGVADDRGPKGLVSFVEKFGFEKTKEIHTGDPEFEKEMRKYARQQLHSVRLGGEVVVYFKKKVLIENK